MRSDNSQWWCTYSVTSHLYLQWKRKKKIYRVWSLSCHYFVGGSCTRADDKKEWRKRKVPGPLREDHPFGLNRTLCRLECCARNTLKKCREGKDCDDPGLWSYSLHNIAPYDATHMFLNLVLHYTLQNLREKKI